MNWNILGLGTMTEHIAGPPELAKIARAIIQCGSAAVGLFICLLLDVFIITKDEHGLVAALRC